MSNDLKLVEGDSHESVAYDLLLSIAYGEEKIINGKMVKADKKWLLDTYAECLRTVKQPEMRFKFSE